MIIFQNPGLIDIRAVTTFGVSVKENDSAIGKFGTGLKYAIAVILRDGGTITIQRGSDDQYRFTTKDEEIRGKVFGVVQMEHLVNGNMESAPLAFTTDHGLNWEPWQAFRELWSNMHDEGGKCFRIDDETPEGMSWLNDDMQYDDKTTIIVTGNAIEKAWENRASIILETEPVRVLDGVAVHAGESKHLYYQGIRVFELEKQTKWTYNLLKNQYLSEDRKLLYVSIAMRQIAQAVMTSSWHAYIDDVLSSGESKFEGNLPWKEVNEVVPSPAFVEIAQGLRDEKRLAGNAKSLFNDLAKQLNRSYGYDDPREVQFTPVEQAILDKAIELVKTTRINLNGIGFRMRSGWSSELKVLLSNDEMSIIFNSSLFAKGDHVEVAKQIIRGIAMRAGGNREEQLANFILFNVFENREIEYEDKEDWHE